jgi:hypothetical protein
VIQFATRFNLVMKPDRRQNPDRRSAWRGSRRMADIRESGPQPVSSISPVAIDAGADWAPDADPSHGDGLEVEGTKYVH